MSLQFKVKDFLRNLCMLKFSLHELIKPNIPILTVPQKWISNITRLINWCFPTPHLVVPLVSNFLLQTIEDEQPVEWLLQSSEQWTWRSGCSTWFSVQHAGTNCWNLKTLLAQAFNTLIHKPLFCSSNSVFNSWTQNLWWIWKRYDFNRNVS